MRKKRIHQDSSKFWDFMLRVGIWGGPCYVGGFRGSELAKHALIGSVIEKVGEFTLEEVLAAAERERQIKELEESISLEINQPLKSITLPEVTRKNEQKDRTLTLPDAPEPKLGKLISPPAEVGNPDFRWLDLIAHPSTVLTLGGRGSGKTAWGFRLLEIFKNKLAPYVIALQKQCEGLLLDWIGISNSLEEVPPGSISLVDEAYLTSHARDWVKVESREICRLLNLSRQQKKSMLSISQQSRHLNLDIVSSANVIVVKNPGMLHPSFERPELRKIMAEAKLAFDSIKGNTQAWSYVYSLDASFSGLVENSLPSFWSNKLSNMYGYGYQKEKAADRFPTSMREEEKMRKAKELHQAGWSY